jgi:DNA-binding transcriptional MerR regulator
MEYRVEELAAAAGVRVDTVRFYQGRGLIEKPSRRGRVAIYEAGHLERLRRIRGLLEQGFTLEQIGRILATPKPSDRADPLLDALVQEGVGQTTFDRAALASEAGVPEALVQAAQAAGLVEPVVIKGEERFTRADVEMARASLEILGAGFPLDVLLQLAITHAGNIQSVTDRAIDLFDDHVRKADVDEERVTDAFRRLLPQLTKLVALHFQRTLVNRALERLERRDEGRALELALEATREGRLEVEWRT